MKKNSLTLIVLTVIYGIFTLTIILCPNLLIAKEKIVIFSGVGSVFGSGFVADAKGFFKEEGLDVTYKTLTSGAAATEGFRSGSAQFLVASDVPFVYLLSGGDSIALAPFSVNRDAIRLMGGPKIEKPSDLKGKKVGLVRKSAAEYFLYLYLKRGGLELEDIQLVNLAPFDQVPALIKGDIDAACIWSPFDLKVKSIGGTKFKEVSNCGNEDYFFYSGVATTKIYAKNHPDEVKGVLKALIKASNWLSDVSLDESNKFLADYLKEIPEDVKHQNFTITWDLTETKRYRRTLKNIEDFLLGRKLISQRIDWSSALGTSFLKAIDPSLVKPD